jgi:DNA-binding PadR family transcriptional regulator
MTRIFGRGELKEAIVAVLSDLDEMHGYGILSELQSRVGGDWKPSPGAIYPALLALVELGWVRTREVDGATLYSLAAEGKHRAAVLSDSSRWRDLSNRAENGVQKRSVGHTLDRFAAQATFRRKLLAENQQAAVEEILRKTMQEIKRVINEGENRG